MMKRSSQLSVPNPLLPIRWLPALLCLLFASCGDSTRSDGGVSEAEAEGTEDQRTETVRAMLVRQITPLPSGIAAAHFLEEQKGDGVLGPSDFTSFCAFRIPPTEVDAWATVLGELEASNTPPPFVSPAKSVSWWLSPEQFARLTFYSPRKLTGRVNGWVGVDSATSEIFAYSFTM